jgi:transcription antitermination factor NusG
MRWACVQTYGAQELKAVEQLKNQGFQAFSPFFIQPRSYLVTHPRAAKEAPMFSCYAFVQLDEDRPSSWGVVNNTYGVIRLLTDRSRNDTPTPLWIPDKVMATFGEITELPTRSLVNAVVAVKVGPFAERIGRVTEMSKDDRLKVLMQILHREVVLEFDPTDVDVLQYAE